MSMCDSTLGKARLGRVWVAEALWRYGRGRGEQGV